MQMIQFRHEMYKATKKSVSHLKINHIENIAQDIFLRFYRSAAKPWGFGCKIRLSLFQAKLVLAVLLFNHCFKLPVLLYPSTVSVILSLRPRTNCLESFRE